MGETDGGNGLVLMSGAMLSKSSIQFSVDGWSCVLSLLFTWGQTMVGASLVAQRVSVCLQCGKPGFSPWVRKIPLEKEMAAHFSTLAWKIPWTEKPGRLQSMGSQRVRHD